MRSAARRQEPLAPNAGISPGTEVSDATEHSIGGDVLWGIAWGLLLAAILSAWAALMSLLFRDKPRTYDVSLAAVVAIYFVGCALGGAFVGLLRPLAKTWPGAAVVGFAAFLPVTSMIVISTDGVPKTLASFDWRGVLGYAAIMGPMLAVLRWNQARRWERKRTDLE